MKVWAYCGEDWIRATTAAGGVKPITSPPASADTVDLDKATAADIVYLNLHGFEGQPHYYGQGQKTIGPTALTAELVRKHQWSGVVVFAEVCFSASSTGSENDGGPIARAFLDNGARAFIGSVSTAYGRIKPVLWDGEADKLMRLFRRTYGRWKDPAVALEIALRWLRLLSFPLDADDKATLEGFVCLEK